LFHSKGVRGKLLSDIVKALEKNVRAGGETITEEGMHLQKSGRSEPWTAAFIVGLSSTIGSLIPLIPFFFLPVVQAMIAAAILALVSLFVGGWIKAKLTVGSPTRSGLELVVAGGLAALGGFIIGSLLQVPV
jgi:predicted membrane protein (TIGR00267 family)